MINIIKFEKRWTRVCTFFPLIYLYRIFRKIRKMFLSILNCLFLTSITIRSSYLYWYVSPSVFCSFECTYRKFWAKKRSSQSFSIRTRNLFNICVCLFTLSWTRTHTIYIHSISQWFIDFVQIFIIFRYHFEFQAWYRR